MDKKTVKLKPEQHQKLSRIKIILQARAGEEMTFADALDWYMNADDPEKEFQKLLEETKEDLLV